MLCDNLGVVGCVQCWLWCVGCGVCTILAGVCAVCTMMAGVFTDLTDYMRKTQICVRAALAIQHVLYDIASGSVLRINSRKRVIVTNRFFAKVK